MTQENIAIKLLEEVLAHFRMNLGPTTSAEEAELMEEIEIYLAQLEECD